jgi:hypothetical protein
LSLDNRIVIELESSLDCSAEYTKKRKGLIIFAGVNVSYVISSGTLVTNFKWLSRQLGRHSAHQRQNNWFETQWHDQWNKEFSQGVKQTSQQTAHDVGFVEVVFIILLLHCPLGKFSQHGSHAIFV